jgi:glycogen debranching enzyme
MTMLVDPDLALGTLQTLARFQGRQVDVRTEEEPGRILHEMRFGETASLALGGGRVYYGTVDASPLFVMLVGELSRWGSRREEVDALLPAADAALAWITDYGDRDGDGYVEYQRTTDRGLQNQGWKDSWDSMRFADGSLAATPIALCEVQGYVYGAMIARSHCATEAGDDALAASLNARAADLKRRFNEDFWVDTADGGYFALGLDRDKRKIDGIGSNMGHCLWTGIVDEEKAPHVARVLLSDGMFSGWGVRTLSAANAGYNPISYHCGSVWPHDNAITAAGLMRYGFADEAHQVMRGMVDASRFFGDLLPELFAGMPRDGLSFPVSYPTSCSPQAWAAASPLLFLRTLLRFEPDIRANKLHLAPAVPDWIGTLRLERIPIMGGHLGIEVTGEVVKVLEVPEDLTIVSDPRRPTIRRER